jgi:trehalose-phosphatase
MTTETMQTPDPKFDLEVFFARVRTAAARVLLLDYDGTLAPFRINPAEAVPYPGVIPLLDEIQQAGHTRVVMVSGRWTKDLVPLLDLKRTPEIWGSHGWERLQPHGEYNVGRISPSALEILVTADEWIAEIEALGGRCERKPAALAFHWRGLENTRIASIRDKVFEKWKELGYVNGLAWHDFDGGIELRVAGHDKGDVVRTLVAEVGSGGVFAYLGDDLTDEPAFKAMPDAGAAILVRPQFRPTAASFWIRPPEELLEFLARWHQEAGGKP